MSSVSSYDGNEKDLFHQRTFDGFTPRQSYLRKSDLMELNDSLRSSRDTDAWSVAATVDDQESVISTNTQKSRLVHDLDDDNLTADGMTFTSTANNHNSRLSLDLSGRSFDIASLDTDTLISQLDARSTTTTRSLAVECDDRTTDGFKSESSSTNEDDNGTHTGNDNDHSTEGLIENDDQQEGQYLCDNDQGPHPLRHQHHHHHHRHHSSHSPVAVNDAIRAPTEPQPCIATVEKTYTHLIEENELLHAQLRHLEITTKHQQNIITSMQSHHPYDALCSAELNSNILSQQLTIWAERVIHFSKQWTATSTQQRQVEHDLFHHMMEYYLHVLPFGSEHQDILNNAYQDQLARFHNTLGAHFAKWYRRQTVQSLARNPATHDYLHVIRMLITQHACGILNIDSALLATSEEWQVLLDHCAKLSLELHSSEHDVLIRFLTPGSTYDGSVMIAVGDDANDTIMAMDDSTADGVTKDHSVERRIKSIVYPLFIDEQDTVLLPARVILE